MTQQEQAQKLNEAFDQTGVKFHDRAATLQAITADGREVAYDADGTVRIHYDGEQLSLKDALTRFAYDNRQHVDARTLPKEGAGTARPGTLAKSDMTLAQKTAYINQHGAEAFSKIPSKNFDTQPVVSRQDWMRLSRAEKVRRLGADPDAFIKLPNATSDQLKGSFINHTALEREKKIRGRG